MGQGQSRLEDSYQKPDSADKKGDEAKKVCKAKDRASEIELEQLSEQQKKTKKLSTSERKKLMRKREVLLKERKAAIEAAAKEAEGPTNKSGRVFVTGQQVTADETAARKKPERDRDAKWGKEVRAIDREVQGIDRLLKQGSEGGTQARFHAPSLINPK